MSKLYYSEQGNVVPLLCEELTRFRRAKKILNLPHTDSPGQLFILARAYPGTVDPLRVAVNGTEVKLLEPTKSGIYRWYEVSVPLPTLVSGANTFEFWTDSWTMNAWSMALEDGHATPESYVSSDEGATWRDHAMGYLNVSRGEYVVRMRLVEGQDGTPPVMEWEDPASPRLQHLRQLLPADALARGRTLDRVRALTTWISTQWEYRNNSNGVAYTPWDAETILAWGATGQGHAGLPPIAMCVHYAVTLATCCTAIGIPARCAAFTGDINGFNGHFTTEVWFDDLRKWVMVDPTIDAILFKGTSPLSVKEIQEAGSDLDSLVRWGPGHAFQIKNPLIKPWIPDNFLQGVCFRHRSVWPRMDFLTNPELTPSGHGSTSYCETDLVWEVKDLHEGFGMFPYFQSARFFDAPPHDFPGPALAGHHASAVTTTGK